MTQLDKWTIREIAEYTRDAQRIVRKCRDLRASHEAIIRAALGQMSLDEGLETLGKLHREYLQKRQEAAHAAPVGSRIGARC